MSYFGCHQCVTYFHYREFRNGSNDNDLIEGLKYVTAFTMKNWEAPPGETYKMADTILGMNNISIRAAVFAVSSDCSDFLETCYWGFNKFPCLDSSKDNLLKFSQSTSYVGPCCSFNANAMNTSFAPFSTNNFGMNSGLTIVGSEGKFSNFSTGLVILIHHPLDYPSESVRTLTVKTGSETFLEIKPSFYSSSGAILDLAPKKRDCYIFTDLDVRFYRESLCIVNCQNNAIFEKCGCYPYYMHNSLNKATKECKLEDSFCYANNFGESCGFFLLLKISFFLQDTIKNTKCTDCLPNCNDVEYDCTAYNTDLTSSSFSVHPL